MKSSGCRKLNYFIHHAIAKFKAFRIAYEIIASEEWGTTLETFGKPLDHSRKSASFSTVKTIERIECKLHSDRKSNLFLIHLIEN